MEYQTYNLGTIVAEAIPHKFIQKTLDDYAKWETTSIPYYPLLSNTKKGEMGQMIGAHIASLYKLEVKERENTDHDLVIDDYKTDVKIACRIHGWYTINHLACFKDIERYMLVHAEPLKNTVGCYWFTIQDVRDNVDSLISHQTKGKEGNLDDYIKNYKTLDELPFLRTMDSWNHF